jgi:hypothetical protein
MSRTPPISVSINGAVDLTGTNRNYIYELIAAGELATALLGRRRVILVDSLREAMMRRMSTSPVSSELSGEMARRASLRRKPNRVRGTPQTV